ncbi:MAG: hypothetical protein HYW24_03195 [Candidatus Aenigmarchaeota archaeon]|nr:hypothetical protein [Candidatus Aenigmarchaeota archaeon]
MDAKTETILGRAFREYGSDLYENVMGRMIDDKFTPTNSIDIIKARLEIAGLSPQGSENDSPEIYRWFNLPIDTCTGVASYRGNIKIVHGPRQLIDIKPNTEYSPKGALKLSGTSGEEYDQAWVAIEGREHKRGDLEKIGLGTDLTKDQIKNHPFWQDLAGDVLSQYIDLAFGYLEKNGHGNQGMPVELGPEEDFPTMRFVSLYGLRDRLGAGAVRSFRFYRQVRLVGLGDEVKPKKTPENKEDDSNEDNRDEGLEEELRLRERQNSQLNSTINKSDPKGMFRYVLNSMRGMKEFEIYGQFYGPVASSIVDGFTSVRQLNPEAIRQYDAGILLSALDEGESTGGVQTLREFITVLKSKLPFKASIEHGYIPMPEENYRILVERLKAAEGS